MSRDDDLDPELGALADLARRVSSRVVKTAPITSDFRTILMIELEGASPSEQEALDEALRSHCRREGIAPVECYILVNTTAPRWGSGAS